MAIRAVAAARDGGGVGHLPAGGALDQAAGARRHARTLADRDTLRRRVQRLAPIEVPPGRKAFMKIGLICMESPPLPHGGIGTFAGTYARALATAGREVTVIEMGPAAA